MKIRQNILMLLLPIALSLAAVAPLRGGTVSMADLIAFQALSADLVAGATTLSYGFDPVSVFTYAGTFDQTGSTGVLGGMYDGQAFGGTLDGAISGDAITYNLSGMLTSGPNMGAMITFNFKQSATNPNSFSLSNSMIGGTPYTGRIGSVTRGNTVVLYGNIQYAYGINNSLKADVGVRIELNTETMMFVSRLDFHGPKPMKVMDSGSYTSTMAGLNFNGAMGEVVTVSVPEPSAIVLGGTAAVVGLGYWLSRRARADHGQREARLGCGAG
jgi:hypothetical protein